MILIEEVAENSSALSNWMSVINGAVGGLVFFVLQKGVSAWFDRGREVFRARFSYAHSQVTETCAGVYERLFRLSRALQATVVEIPSDEKDRIARRKHLTECVGDLRDYAGSREIFLLNSVSSAILKYLANATHSIEEYDLWIRDKEDDCRRKAVEQAKEAHVLMYAIRDLLRKNITGRLPRKGVMAATGVDEQAGP